MQNNNEKIVFYKRVSFKFVLFVFISTVFVFFLSAIWQIKEISDQRINDLHNRAKFLASIQAGALSTPLWNLEELAIKNTLQSLSDDPDFTSAIVVDEKGKEKFFHGLRETEKTYSVTSHIIYSGDLIGDIVLNFSLKKIEKDKKELAFKIFIQSSISMITMLISCFFCLQMIISFKKAAFSHD